MTKKSFFDSAFGRYLLPGIILQSVLIGGGYATGREVISFGAKYGSLGWISGFTMLIGFALIAFLTFGLARKFKAFDYKSLVKLLIGPFWFIYEILYLGMLIVTLAVMAAATGSILKTTLGINYWAGVIGIMLLVGILNYFGEHIIEKFKTVGTLALYFAYFTFGIMVITTNWDSILLTFKAGDVNFVESSSITSAIWSGVLYFSFCVAVFPAALFVIKRHKTLKDTFVSSIFSGVLMLVPWFITYFSLMAYYTSEKVMGAEIPWLQMLNNYGVWVVVIFGIAVGWTLVETATGYILAFIERLEQGLRNKGKKPMKKYKKVLLLWGCFLQPLFLLDLEL